jgi:diguanylate cyclase (GGDEF)-like protein/PAS domain S-box-containing protein
MRATTQNTSDPAPSGALGEVDRNETAPDHVPVGARGAYKDAPKEQVHRLHPGPATLAEEQGHGGSADDHGSKQHQQEEHDGKCTGFSQIGNRGAAHCDKNSAPDEISAPRVRKGEVPSARKDSGVDPHWLHRRLQVLPADGKAFRGDGANSSLQSHRRSYAGYRPLANAVGRPFALAFFAAAAGASTLWTLQAGIGPTWGQFLTTILPIATASALVCAFAQSCLRPKTSDEERARSIAAAFHELDALLLRGRDAPQIMQHICERLAGILDLELVRVVRKTHGGNVVHMAAAGPRLQFEKDKRTAVRWDTTPEGMGPTGLAIRSGAAQSVRVEDPAYRIWRDVAMKHGIKSVQSTPLHVAGNVYGALTAYGSRTNTFADARMQRWIQDAVARLTVALESIEIQARLHMFRLALESTQAAAFITDHRGMIQWANPAFAELCGYPTEEILGSRPSLFNSGIHQGSYFAHIWNKILAGHEWSGEYVNRRKNGTTYRVHQTITPILSDAGDLTHFVAVNEDVTNAYEERKEIERLAHYDIVTNLPNRRVFLDLLAHAIPRAKRDEQCLAVLFLDLDAFKAVNDTYGHAIGDELLRLVAVRLKDQVRESDTVARLAGDEFTILLTTIHSAEDAALVAAKVVEAIGAPFLIEGHSVQVGVSVGIALYPPHGTTTEALINAADMAMYEAKSSGGLNYAFSQPPQELPQQGVSVGH